MEVHPLYPDAVLTFDAADLVRDHPPRISDANKRLVYDLACPPGCVHRGEITVLRYRAAPLPAPWVLPDQSLTAPLFDADRTAVDVRPDTFTYDPVPDPEHTLEWHLNFADPHLFCAYGGPLFAQDELQVAEHPALASLREALDGSRLRPLTAEHGTATPVLIRGVERRCAVATAPDPAAGRPHGLYGNAFAAADPDTVRRAVTVLDPPTVSNLVAMAAPAYGRGRYTRDDVELVLSTAHTAFSAARLETTATLGQDARTVVHTGYWGCGAFGGNRVLMVALQLVAAVMAELDALVIHTVTEPGAAPAAQALRFVLDELLPAGRAGSTGGLVERAVAEGFEWGVGNGT